MEKLRLASLLLALFSTCFFSPAATFSIQHHHKYYATRRLVARPHRRSSIRFAHNKNDEPPVSFKEWHSQLVEAVATEDYLRAADLSKSMQERLHVTNGMSWKGVVAPWLLDRLTTLGFGIPTTIQICALEAVNRALLGSSHQGNDNNSLLFEDRLLAAGANLGIVISGTTGAGKTLAYAVPLLSTLSEALFLRQRLRVSDEEAVGDTAGDLADRINVVTSPSLLTSSYSSTRKKKNSPIATGASLGRGSADGVRSPLALIVVPSRELGVQTAKTLYRLVGGSFREDEVVATPKPPKYKGPKGVKIGTVLDEEDAKMGLKLQTDVAITTPEFLDKLIRDGDILPSVLRVIAFDEADLSLEKFSGDTLVKLFEERNDVRLTFLVGASVTESLGNYAVSSKILPEGSSFIATATSCAPLTRESANVLPSREAATLQDLNVCLYPDLEHERVIVPPGSTNLLVLTRLLRKELRDFDEGANRRMDNPDRPRVVVFFPDEKTAKAAIVPLRDALWGKHRLCVLLPTEGVMPLTIMDQFKRNETTVMLATPNSVRGLDFPALSHVYTTYAPSDPREYLHLAGRVGRVGHRSKGRVISVLSQAAAPELDALANTLGFTFKDIEAPKEMFDVREEVDEDGETVLEGDGDVEQMRRLLEDSFALLGEDTSGSLNATGNDDAMRE